MRVGCATRTNSNRMLGIFCWLRITTRLLRATFKELVEQCPGPRPRTFGKFSSSFVISGIYFSLNECAQVIHVQARVCPLSKLLASDCQCRILFHAHLPPNAIAHARASSHVACSDLLGARSLVNPTISEPER